MWTGTFGIQIGTITSPEQFNGPQARPASQEGSETMKYHIKISQLQLYCQSRLDCAVLTSACRYDQRQQGQRMRRHTRHEFRQIMVANSFV
jgi:hypothetical protein